MKTTIQAGTKGLGLALLVAGLGLLVRALQFATLDVDATAAEYVRGTAAAPAVYVLRK